MNKIIKKYSFLKVITQSIYFVALFILLYNFADLVMEKPKGDIYYFCFILFYFLVYIFSICVHELGHLCFGLSARMKFVSFRVLNVLIEKEQQKIKFKFCPMIPGVLGCCLMEFDENIKYKKDKIILYYLGGVIFNLILTIIFCFILIISNNTILNYCALLIILFNLQMFFYNLIPAIQKSGSTSDMLSIMDYLKSPNYIETNIRISKINNYVEQGKKLIELDKDLFIRPKELNNYSDVLMSIFYIEYIMDDDKYDEAIKCIEELLVNEYDILSNANVNLLKIQLLVAVLYSGKDFDKYDNYIDKKFYSYLSAMSKIVPTFLAILYLCNVFLKKDLKESDKILRNIEIVRNNIKDNKVVEELDELVQKIDERKDNTKS